MLRTSLAKLLTVKIGLVCAAAAGVGGVAVAASAGQLPGPLHFGAAPASTGSSHHPKPSDSDDPTAWPTAWPSHTLPPGLAALCQKYTAQDRDHRGQAVGDPKFKDLVDRAGVKDRDHVDKFCDFLLHGHGSPPSGFPTSHPTDLPKPSGFPTTWPKPTVPPTVMPSRHGR